MNDHDIDVTIDEVILDGPLGARTEALREALAAHLGRLVAERGLPARGDLHLPSASFDVPRDLGADAIAARVAQGIYERLEAEAGRGGRR